MAALKAEVLKAPALKVQVLGGTAAKDDVTLEAAVFGAEL